MNNFQAIPFLFQVAFPDAADAVSVWSGWTTCLIRAVTADSAPTL